MLLIDELGGLLLTGSLSVLATYFPNTVGGNFDSLQIEHLN